MLLEVWQPGSFQHVPQIISVAVFVLLFREGILLSLSSFRCATSPPWLVAYIAWFCGVVQRSLLLLTGCSWLTEADDRRMFYHFQFPMSWKAKVYQSASLHSLEYPVVFVGS